MALAARKSHLDAGVFTILGSTYTKMFKNWHFTIEDIEQNGQSIDEGYADAVGAKSRASFGGSLFRTNAGARQTMLSFTVFSIGGTDVLGRLRSGSMSGTTQIDEGSAGGDQWEIPYAQGTDLSINARLQIASAAAYTNIMKGAMAAREVSVVMTMGNFSATIPMKLSRASHMIDVSRIQEEDVSLKLKGTITVTPTGDPVLVSALTGAAAGAYSIATGANTYANTDGCVVSQFGFNFASGQIIEDNFEFLSCGVPTIT